MAVKFFAREAAEISNLQSLENCIMVHIGRHPRYLLRDFVFRRTIMTKSRSDQMVERLRNMQAAAPDIEASAVVSVDGLIMASALQQGVEEDRVSAMSAAMLSLGERISNELGRAGLEQVYIKGDAGSIVLTSVGEEAVLTALARHEAKLGMIFLEMRRAAEDLTKLVG
jgi:predicted regulator of Ras-like GTPase activity (Roadblock/LC7/MglB family)